MGEGLAALGSFGSGGLMAVQAGMLDLSKPENVAGLALKTAAQADLLQQEVRITLEGMREEMHKQSASLDTLATTVSEYSSHSEGLARLAAAIDKQSLTWDTWRSRHELENRDVADKVTAARGALRMLAWGAGFLVALITGIIQMQFNGAASDRARVERKIDTESQRIEAQQLREHQRMDAEVAEIKRRVDEIQGTQGAR